MLMHSLSAQHADLVLRRCEGGVDLALQYSKMWCRYAKELLTWMEKRFSLGKEPVLSVHLCVGLWTCPPLSLSIFPCV